MAPKYDIFFSYARTDKDAAAPFFDALKAADLTVFVDEEGVKNFESITRRIKESLANSKVLVAYYSHTYPQRAACQWELTAAFITGQAAGDPRDRVLVLNPEESAIHLNPAELGDAKYPALGAEASPTRVAEFVAEHLKSIETYLGEVKSLNTPNWYPRNPQTWERFVGRLKQLWDVHRSLSGGKLTLITGKEGPGTAQVRGLGGIGKTVLAEEYAQRFQYAFPGGVFWLSAKAATDNASSIEVRTREFSNVALHLGIDISGMKIERIVGEIQRLFAQDEKPVLWLIDDLPVGLEDGEFHLWHGPGKFSSTLITTRSTTYRGEHVDLERLTEEEAFELLSLHRPPNHGEKEDVRGLANDLGCHALACEVTGALLAKGAHTYAQYRDLLNEPTDDALKLAENLTDVLPHDQKRSIAESLLRSILAIGDTGLELLQIATHLGPTEFSGNLANITFTTLHGDKEGRFVEGSDRAVAHSLARRIPSSNPSYQVHEIVLRTIRYHFMSGDQVSETSVRTSAVGALLKILPEATDARNHAKLANDIGQARFLLNALPEENDTLNLKGWVGRYEYEQGVFEEARKLEEQVLEASRRLLGKEHPKTLTSMNNLASTLEAQGDLEGARELEEQVLEASRRLLGEEHPKTLTSMNNLASTLWAQGDLEGARELEEQVLEASRRLLGEEHPETLTSMNNLASTLEAQGDLEGARELEEQVLEASRRLLGEEHPETLTSMNNLASTLWAQGDLEGARELEEQVLEASRRLLGEEHPKTLTSMNNLASTLRAQGDLEGARGLQEQVLEARSRLLGEEHPKTLTSMNNLASTLRAQGDLEGARGLQEQVLEASRRLLGEEHPKTLTSMNNLASTLWAQGDLEGARELEEQVLEARSRLLGEEHLETLTSMNNLASTLEAQGDLEGARRLVGTAVSIAARTLEPSVPIRKALEAFAQRLGL